MKKNDFLSTDFLEFQKEIMKLLIKYNISKEVYCGSEDNYLLLDLSKKVNIEILRRQLYSKGYINIRKVYFDENNLILRERTEENYKYINEVVFQITNYEDKQLRFEKNYYIRNSSNEWISMKLYMNEHFMDYFIINYLDKLVNDISGKKDWFYVRYKDPKSHIRIRIYVGDTSDVSYSKIRKLLYKLERKK